LLPKNKTRTVKPHYSNYATNTTTTRNHLPIHRNRRNKGDIQGKNNERQLLIYCCRRPVQRRKTVINRNFSTQSDTTNILNGLSGVRFPGRNTSKTHNMLNSADIIKYNNDLWLSQDYIIDSGVKYDYLRVAKTRANKGAKSWTYETIANRCYFKYSALPRTATAKLPEPGTLAANAVTVENDIVSLVSKALYSSFKVFLKGMSDDEARSAAIIHEASIYVRNNNISFSKSLFFEQLCAEIKLHSLKYLPVSWRNLRDKVQAYSEGTHIGQLVYAKNRGNENHAMFTNNDIVLNWLLDLAKSEHNYTAAMVSRKLTRKCIQESISKIPSPRWVSDWMGKPESQFLISQRFGANSRHNAKYRSYVPTLGALYAGDCWELDGTRVNIIDHKAVVMKDGKKVTTNEFLYIVAVRDVMSGHILGWEYCHNESAEVITNALAMAVRNAGYLPYEFRYDKFPGHDTSDWMFIENSLSRMGVVMTQTTKAEGKAHIERWWGTLQTVFMSESDLYYGEGVKSSRKYAHRSKDYVAKMRSWASKNKFNFDDASRVTNKILEAWSSTPYSAWSTKFKAIDKSPLELHNECSRPYTIEISHPKFCYLFGIRKEVSIRNFMILTQIDNATYYYGIDDCEVAEKYTGVKTINCFDPENFDKVHMFLGENYLGSFDRITPAQQYGPNKDMRAVGKMKAISEKMKNHRDAKISKLQESEYEYSEEPVTVTSETGILLGHKVAKRDYEAAESKFLQSEWEDEGEGLKINVRNKY